MKYFSMFSGIGGFELGIQYASDKKFRIKEWETSSLYRQDISSVTSESIQRQYPTCVGYSEIDKYAVKIYEKHFKGHKNYGDTRRIIWEEVPDFDFLCGGFPCQAFSIAGKRGGFKDTRGTLFFEIARAISVKRPKLLLLENVKGLLSHDNGRTFGTILATLSELGYICEWQVLNSKDFGVPQNRERVFIVGHLRGTSRPEVFPIGESGQEGCGKLGLQNSRQIACSLRAGDYKGIHNNVREITIINKNGVDKKKNYACTLSGGGHSGGNHSDMDLIMRDGRDNRSCLRAGRVPEIGYEGYSIRRITPTECERLQGFPDGWTEGISDTQRYKCLGNAVTVNVIEVIMERIFRPTPHRAMRRSENEKGRKEYEHEPMF